MPTIDEFLVILGLSFTALSGGFVLDHFFGFFKSEPIKFVRKPLFYSGMMREFVALVYQAIFSWFGERFLTPRYIFRSAHFS